MNQDDLKRAVAKAALEHVPTGGIIGVGSGSTVNCFIDALATIRHRIDGAVAASEASAERLKRLGIEVHELNNIDDLAVYIDGADEITSELAMLKGGGGALTREKIIAAVARKFVCIADESKLVRVLGKFPLPLEVIPMARSYVGRQMVRLGGHPALRPRYKTDNGNVIIDVHDLHIVNPLDLENMLNQIAGVVSNGLFAHRSADVALLSNASGVQTLTRSSRPA